MTTILSIPHKYYVSPTNNFETEITDVIRSGNRYISKFSSFWILELGVYSHHKRFKPNRHYSTYRKYDLTKRNFNTLIGDHII